MWFTYSIPVRDIFPRSDISKMPKLLWICLSTTQQVRTDTTDCREEAFTSVCGQASYNNPMAIWYFAAGFGVVHGRLYTSDIIIHGALIVKSTTFLSLEVFTFKYPTLPYLISTLPFTLFETYSFVARLCSRFVEWSCLRAQPFDWKIPLKIPSNQG